jgi:hypothetical protein
MTKPVEVFRVRDERIEIFRCPRSLLTPELLEVIDFAVTRYLAKLSPAEARRLPAGLVSAVEYVVSLLEENAPHV